MTTSNASALLVLFLKISFEAPSPSPPFRSPEDVRYASACDRQHNGRQDDAANTYPDWDVELDDVAVLDFLDGFVPDVPKGFLKCFAEKRSPGSLNCTAACSAGDLDLDLNLDFDPDPTPADPILPLDVADVPLQAALLDPLDLQNNEDQDACALSREDVMDLISELQAPPPAPRAVRPALTIKEERRRAKVARWKEKRRRQKARLYDPEMMRKIQERKLEKKRRRDVAMSRHRKGGRFARKGPEFVSITELQ